MKLVREYINEKFTEEGDPIKDMGIGTKIIYYDFDKQGSDTYSLIFSSKFFSDEIIKILKKDEFFYNREVQTWESRALRSKYFWLRRAPFIFKEIEKIPQYIIIKMNRFKNSFSVPQYESVNEKFTEESDPIVDMDIGGFSYHTLKPGAIIQPKRSMQFGTRTGTLVSRGGKRVWPEVLILIKHASQIYQSKDMYLSGFTFSYRGIEEVYKYREKLQRGELTPQATRYWVNRIKICIKEKSFNNRFEIIERGF